jgi:hypothetical protein
MCCVVVAVISSSFIRFWPISNDWKAREVIYEIDITSFLRK